MDILRQGEIKTGRDYGAPQVVRWMMVADNRFLFVDDARNIAGEIVVADDNLDSEFFGPLRDRADEALAEEVLGYYDAGLYNWSGEAWDALGRR